MAISVPITQTKKDMSQKFLALTNGKKPFETIQFRIAVTPLNGRKGLYLTSVVDTGATHTAIARRCADILGLEPIEYMWMNTASGRELSPVYEVDIHITDFKLEHVRMVGLPLTKDDALLGMDLLGRCCIQMGPFKDGTYGFTIQFP